ncbi:MAG TPA: chromosome segregation protein SMC, partial [Burkholderiales bacterium]|nr:chromosome segregation protein SMC [Burkholderiales bacterium]
MRLTHIKLAGFKSFVDSTHIVVPGALVGVVGPNGCGKSNVIDAVRWVLGESRAGALRGEVMQDVIFNGSATRKPVSRASVELIFDNRLQQAAGPWSAYPEISIKRVLLRDSESAYYINNQHVRRRDVADIFLGTGLGGRGYAIIEQGMISRVVEARPEDLRVYLEEAAGVSKYRERRRETEVKLADARHNLNRVQDILRELAEQLVKLKEQARLAERYRELQQRAQTTQHLIWFMRKREAQAARERALREEARIQNELEAETAKLRKAELEVEALRDRNDERNEALNARQGAFYQASAEVAQLEQALQHLRDNRRRLETQIHNLRGQLAQQQEQRNSAAAELEHWQVELSAASAEVAAAAETESAEAGALPRAEAQWRASRDRVGEKLRAVSEARERLNVEETHHDHATRAIEQLGLREQRLAREQQQLVVPDPTHVEALRQELAAAEERLAESRAKLAEAEQRLPERERERSQILAQLDRERSELTSHRARRDALEALQSKLKSDETLNAWMSERGLGALSRLWQAIGIEPGWEDALEAVLRERLNGIAIDGQNGLLEGEPPPRRLALFELANGIGSEQQDAAWHPGRPLRDYVLLKDPAVASALDDWLTGVYAVADRGAAQAGRSALPTGACLVCPEGHVFTRHTVSFYAPDSALHGVISRQREIEELQDRIDALRARLENTTAVFNQADAGLTSCRAELNACSSRCAAEQQSVHELQVAALKAAQELDGARERERQLEHGLADLFSQMQHQTVLRQAAENRAAGLKTILGQLQDELAQTSRSCEASEASYKAGRDRLERAREQLSSARFQQTLCEQKIKDIGERVQLCDETRREL